MRQTKFSIVLKNRAFKAAHPRLLFCLALAPIGLSAASAEYGYAQTNLVANKDEFHPKIVDPKMLNAWGIALRPPGAGGHIWISNARSGTSSEFIGDVNENPLHQDGLKIVELVCPGWTDHGYAFVTGQAYNAASDLPGQPVEFPVSGPATNYKMTPAQPVKGGYDGSAKFAFVTEDGCINAWSSGTAVAMDRTPIVVDYSKSGQKYPSKYNCVFTGTAFTLNAVDSPSYKKTGGNRLFATDIRNNVIRVFDNRWKDITDSFKFQTPGTVRDLSPFNIADMNGHLFVTYAKFDANSDEGQEQVNAAGLGHVVEYDEDGRLVKDYTDHGLLNTPWGMAIAPATFGEFANDLLVANFGDGTISAFDRTTGDFIGFLRDQDSKIISIDGIWGLAFGNGHSLGSADSLYFTAGPNNEQDGLFGRLDSRKHEFDIIAAKAAIPLPKKK